MNAFIKAVKDTRISHAKEAQVKLKMFITQAGVVSGQPIRDNQASLIAQILEKDLRESFQVLTLSEVEHALLQGVRREYTDFIGLTNANIYKWLKQYKDSPERMEAIAKSREQAKAMLPEKTQPTKEEVFDLSCKYIVNLFKEFKESGYIRDYGNPAYHFLDQYGLIRLSADRKKELMAQAKQSLIDKAMMKKDSVPSATQKLETHRLINALIKDQQDAEAQIIAEAKRIALRDYFQNLIDFDQDIEPELKAITTKT